MFPAQAGMNRIGETNILVVNGVPRTGGDEPDKGVLIDHAGKCSPHRRG